MTTSQMLVALLGSGALFSFLGVVVTLYFTRRKTAAETGKFLADSHRTDAETSKTYAEQVESAVGRLVEWMPRFEAATQALALCMREKAEAEIKMREAEAETRRIESYAEGLRLEVVELQKQMTDKNRMLNEGK